MSVKGLEESEKLAAKIQNNILRSLNKQRIELADELAKVKFLLGDKDALTQWRTDLAPKARISAIRLLLNETEKLYLDSGDSQSAKLFRQRMEKALKQKLTNLKANMLEVKIRSEKFKAQTRQKTLIGLTEVKRDAALREAYSQARTAGGYLDGKSLSIFGRAFLEDLVTLETKAAGSKTLGEYMANMYNIYEDKIKDIFVSGIIRGDSYQTMEQNLIKATNLTASKAREIVRTEANAIMNESVLGAINENPLVKGYRFRAVLDRRTSELCQKHDGDYIKKEDVEPGVNYPPLHPNCRSTVTTVLVNENEKEDTMQRYTKNGSNQWVPVPPGMKYPEFKREYLTRATGSLPESEAQKLL